MSVYVGGKRLELSVLGPCSASWAPVHRGLGEVTVSPLSLFIVLEKAQTALGPYLQ